MTKRLRVMALVVFMLIVCTGTVSAYSADAKRVKVIDDGVEAYYKTDMETVGEFLAEAGITLDTTDKMDCSVKAPIKEEANGLMVIEITRSFPVVLNLDGVPRMVTVIGGSTVADAIAMVDGELPPDYRIENTNESTKLSANMAINLTSLKKNVYSTIETLPFETITRENAELDYGIEQIVQQGSEGELKITITETFEGGTKTKTEETGREITKQPVNTIIEIGTAKAVETTSGKLGYKRAMNVTATGYTPFDPGCTGITATGTQARFGVIAVDPKTIPLGSKVYIPGYGVATAEDTGGAIKGNRIDLCYQTTGEAYGWGVRNITIYVLE